MSPENLNATLDLVSEDFNLQDLLRTRIAEGGDRPAYVFVGNDLEASEVMTYEALGAAVETVARHLRRHTSPGDRVLLAFNNDLEAVQLFWGCIQAGVIPIPAPAPDPATVDRDRSRLGGISADSGAVLALTHDTHLDAARFHLPELPWHSLRTLQGAPRPTPAGCTAMDDAVQSEIAYLQYTSGSTSAPRGVIVTHGNVLAQCRALMNGPDTHRMRGLVWLPWFHDYGLVHGVVQPFYSGGTSFLMSTAQFMLRPLRWLEAVAKHRITHSGAPNFAYAACVKALARSTDWSARLDTWQLATCGAEPVRATTVDEFVNAFQPFGFNAAALAPSYGLAESVLAVTVRDTKAPLLQLTVDAQALERHDVKPVAVQASGTRTLVGCGPALPGFDLRIVDPATGQPCAAGRIGEIWVAGPSVGQGYWGQEEASATVFGATLADEATSDTHFLRTGDLGFLHAGELFVAGRLKDLIVVNGRNLYPQDIERTAEQLQVNTRAGGVIAISVDNGLKESVVILIECSRRPSARAVQELLDNIRKQVAIEHQLELLDVVPMRAGSLPRTSSGKPQRGVARRLYMEGAFETLRLASEPATSAPLAAEGDVDAALIETLVALWSDVLGQEIVQPDANFFDLGGDSLLATQLVSRMRTRLGIDLPIRAVFESPTVRGLAQQVARTQRGSKDSTTHLMREPAEPPVPRVPGTRVNLSFSQERMWFMHELAPQSSAYNVPVALRLQGVVDVEAMTAALERVVERHEILRTRFIKTPDGLAGEILPVPDAIIEQVDLSSNDSPASDDVLHRHLAKVACTPFQLDQCPLFRVQLIRVSDQQTVLLMVLHHIVTDQWSFAQMVRELSVHYSAAVSGNTASLPSLPVQYADYAGWHRGWFEGARRTQETAFWSRRLSGLEPLPLNEDFPRPRQQSFRGSSVRLPLGAEDIQGLRRLGATHGASVSMVLIAALNVMLLRHTGKTDIAVGVPIANRHHLASENLLGTFVNTLVFRTDLGGDPDFLTVLSRVREVSLEAFAHQDMPIELLVRELAGRPDSSRQPLFNVMFNQVNAKVRGTEFEGLSWSRFDFDRASTQFDLTVVADMIYDNSLVIEYATDLFARETVQRMGEHLQNILRNAVETPETRVSTIPLLSDMELARLQDWSLGPNGLPSAPTVVDWVAKGVQLSPQQVAVVSGNSRLTHQELDEASNRLARLLRQRGVVRGTRVGICLPRGLNIVIALLAILKTGAAYVPLDPAYPSQRLNHQIEDADLVLLVTEGSVAPARTQPPSLLLDVDAALAAASSCAPLEVEPRESSRSEDPAYVIYTSGSTGTPKGVAVPHRAVVNLLASMASEPGFTARDRLLAVTTPSFDIAVLELLLPLGTGGTVVVASEAEATDGRALADLMAREQITVLQATPSRWHLLLDSGWTGSPALKALVGGEPLTPSLAAQLMPRCAEVWNMYGPTETTVWSSCWKVSSDMPQAIALGLPVANTSIQVLDEYLQPTPIGVPGEIYIGGTGVALGYYKRPELTSERFIDRPEAPVLENRRIYRTGDRGRWRHDGSLEHGGRLDDQVKVRGFRVELGEIESHLLSHPGVSRAIAMLREDPAGQVRLVAYVVPEGPMPNRETLQQHLRQWLPDPMVPSQFVELTTIPLLPNGKTDRKALSLVAINPTVSSTAMVAPRNATEATILTIWQEALKIEKIGVHDNFFDLGGHSILAVGVMGRIESALERPCTMRLMFDHPTVAELAAALSESAPQSTSEVPVLVLQPQGKGPGLFLLAGAERYLPLARRLDPDMPVYGVYSQTEINLLRWPADIPPPPVSVEKLALEYLALIRGVQPQGPYYLGGFSIGGALAYEVAQRLREAGESIGLVILLDTMLPGRGLRHLWAAARRRWRLISMHGLAHLTHVFKVYRDQVATRQEPGGLRIQAYTQAMRSYNARASNVPVAFMQAGGDAAAEPAYGWKSLVPGLAVEQVPGRHMDFMEPPNVDVLASALRAHIAKARGDISV
ncbi:amino acid adenylation domain-containing protein [Hydrogenophaga sp.]|uniref:amino acid adenylation domain-containing protein n=1 Tax=Hydrogenophaga sp. TaxID=1904254 RepID=UPI003F71F59A